MQPDFFSRMWALAGRMTVKWPLRWTAITASHSSSVMLKIIRSRRMPAQQTTMCRSPNDLSAASTMALPPAIVATFSALARARPPAFSISLTTAVAGHEMARVAEVSVREELADRREGLAHALASLVERAAGLLARGRLEDAIVGHERHDEVNVVPVPALAERFQVLDRHHRRVSSHMKPSVVARLTTAAYTQRVMVTMSKNGRPVAAWMAWPHDEKLVPSQTKAPMRGSRSTMRVASATSCISTLSVSIQSRFCTNTL